MRVERPADWETHSYVQLNHKLSTLNRFRTPPPTAPPLSVLSRGRGEHCAFANFTVFSLFPHYSISNFNSHKLSTIDRFWTPPPAAPPLSALYARQRRILLRCCVSIFCKQFLSVDNMHYPRSACEQGVPCFCVSWAKAPYCSVLPTYMRILAKIYWFVGIAMDCRESESLCCRMVWG